MEPKKFEVDENTKKALRHIFDNAMGRPVVFKTTPTKHDVKPDTIGVSGTDIYLKSPDGKLLKITGVEVTE